MNEVLLVVLLLVASGLAGIGIGLFIAKRIERRRWTTTWSGSDDSYTEHHREAEL